MPRGSKTVIIDFYDVLGIARNETQDKIKKAYYTLAKTWHPDKNPDCNFSGVNMFSLIQEAYEKLSDPYQRSRYDQELWVFERNYGKIRSNKLYRETPRRAEPKSTHSNSQMKESTFRSFTAPPSGDCSENNKAFKPSTLTRKISLTLEELFSGLTKKLKITRSFLDGRQIQEIIEVKIPAGWKKGHTVLAMAAGDQLPGGKFQDIVFEIEPKPHDLFYLEGNDLVQEVQLTLLESLCGFSKQIQHIAGEFFCYSTVKCTGHGFVDRLPGGGLPNPTDPLHCFDLLLRFNVSLPERLSSEQISCLHSVF